MSCGSWVVRQRLDLTRNTFASGDAGLGTASENLFDGIERGVIDPFSESEIEDVAGRSVAEGQHLKGFKNRERNISRRVDGGGINGSGDGQTPIAGLRGGDVLLGGEAKFLDPLADFSVVGAALRVEGGTNFHMSELASGDHEQTEGNAVGRLRGWSHYAMVRELVGESRLQALGLAIENALEEGSIRAMPGAQSVPERLRSRTGSERAGRLRWFGAWAALGCPSRKPCSRI